MEGWPSGPRQRFAKPCPFGGSWVRIPLLPYFYPLILLIILWYTGLMAELYKRNPNTKCIICGKPIYKRPHELQKNNGRVFCSLNCYGFSCRKEIPCVICGKLILSGLHRKTCSRGCANKHRAGIKYKMNGPRDKVKKQRSLKLKLLKQRGKLCEKCGYNIYEILVVHHKDKNRENNKLENLELICPNCHAKEHYFKNNWLNKIK